MRLEDALEFIASELNCTVEYITQKSRKQNVIYNKHIAAYVLKKTFPERSLKEIGDLFGGWDHSSVINAIKNVENNSIKGQLEAANLIIGKINSMNHKTVWIYYAHATLNGLYTMPKVF